jgi:hypothetical protein
VEKSQTHKNKFKCKGFSGRLLHHRLLVRVGGGQGRHQPASRRADDQLCSRIMILKPWIPDGQVVHVGQQDEFVNLFLQPKI